jgi:hypothetical protein
MLAVPRVQGTQGLARLSSEVKRQWEVMEMREYGQCEGSSGRLTHLYPEERLESGQEAPITLQALVKGKRKQQSPRERGGKCVIETPRKILVFRGHIP